MLTRIAEYLVQSRTRKLVMIFASFLFILYITAIPFSATPDFSFDFPQYSTPNPTSRHC